MDSLNQPGRPLCYPNSCQDHLRTAKVSWQIGSESLGREPVTAQIRNSSTNFTSHNLSVRFQGRVPKIFTRHEPKTRQYLKAWKVLKIPVGICFSPSETTMWNELYLKYVKYVKLKKATQDVNSKWSWVKSRHHNLQLHCHPLTQHAVMPL